MSENKVTYVFDIKLELKAWLWFAPIYWDRETKEIKPRRFCYWIFELALWMHHSMLFIAAGLGIDIEESYPIKITKLNLQRSE